MNCEHCNNILSNLSNLNYHKLHNKKCLIKQGFTDNLNINQIFSCKLCLKKFSTKNNLGRHTCLKKKHIKENGLGISTEPIQINDSSCNRIITGSSALEIIYLSKINGTFIFES